MKYKILKMLGKGSYAEVFLAIDTNTSSKVAIKRFFTKNRDIDNSFKNELKICKIIKDNINCPYIVNILDVYNDDTYTYLVMEYAPHGDLENFISRSFKKRNGINEKIIDRVILQTKEAISCLHENNIIHRDIKSSNILIFDNKTIKISDFGVSKYLDNSKFARSSIGTPYYMSPAIVRGEKYSYNVDYWALGCLIYKMTTNKYPFEAENIIKLVKKIKESRYDKYKIPKKYSKLIDDLLNPSYDKELIDFELNNRNHEIEEFIQYNCKTFINSPTNKYFRSKMFDNNEPDNIDSNQKIKNNFDYKNIQQSESGYSNYYVPIPKPIITSEDINRPKISNFEPNTENAMKQQNPKDFATNPRDSDRRSYSKYNNLPPINFSPSNKYNEEKEIKLQNFYKRKKLYNLKPIESNECKVYKPDVLHHDHLGHPKIKRHNSNDYVNHNYNLNRKNSYQQVNYGGLPPLNPISNRYEKKNKNFIEKNFIKENKRNIKRIKRINDLLKNLPDKKEILNLIKYSSLRKAPKQYLENLKKACI